MATESLSASIFGEGKVDADGGLSNLFSATSSSILPAKPNNVDFLETPSERTKREKKEEKKKRRKRKGDVGDDNDNNDNNNERDGDNVNKSSSADIANASPAGKKRKSNEKKGESKQDNNTSEVATKIDDDDCDEKKVDTKSSSNEQECTVFVGNLPMDITRKSLESMFKECGKIKSSRLRSYGTDGVKVAPEHAGNQNLVKKVAVNTNKLLAKSPKKTAQGYVVFESIESVEKALEMNNTNVPNGNGSLMLRVDRSKPTLDSTRSVFVGNLPYKANEMTLRTHFNHGCDWDDNDNFIEGVRIVRDKDTMQCKGFGYILLKDKSCVPQALRMHESTYMKRDLRVLVCGKRFKGRKGAPKEGSVEPMGAQRRVMNSSNGKKSNASIKDLIRGPKEERKNKRGMKKIGVKKAGIGGMSKRAASGKKLDKRVKKIQKRLQKGMGKGRK